MCCSWVLSYFGVPFTFCLFIGLNHHQHSPKIFAARKHGCGWTKSVGTSLKPWDTVIWVVDKGINHRCPSWLIWSKNRGRFLVHLVVQSTTSETHLFPKKDTDGINLLGFFGAKRMGFVHRQRGTPVSVRRRNPQLRSARFLTPAPNRPKTFAARWKFGFERLGLCF